MDAREQLPSDRMRLADRLDLLRRDRRGAALVEFGFVALPLAALFVAILQTSLTFFAQQTLETAAEKSVRQLITGAAQRNNMTASDFKASVCSKLSSFMKCANVLIDVQQSTGFSGVSTTPPTITYDSSGKINNGLNFDPGGAGTINVVKIMYVWQEQKGPLGFDLSNLRGGNRLLVATSVFKTEPYLE